MAEPGGLSSVGSHRVGHDWSDLAAVAANSKLSLYQWVWNAWTSLENITQEDGLLQCYVQLSQTRLKGVYTAQKEDLHQGFNKYEHKWITSLLEKFVVAVPWKLEMTVVAAVTSDSLIERE